MGRKWKLISSLLLAGKKAFNTIARQRGPGCKHNLPTGTSQAIGLILSLRSSIRRPEGKTAALI